MCDRVKIKKIKYRFVKYLSKIFLGEISGKMPRNAVRSLIEVIEDRTINKHFSDVDIYQPTLIEKYNFPNNYPLYFRREKAFDIRYIYKLKNVIVSPTSGLCWLEEGKVFIESVGSLQRVMGWGENLIEIVKPVNCSEKTEIICLADTGYFHWLLEKLPVFIEIFNKTKNAKIVLPLETNKYHLDVIKILLKKDSEDKIIKSDKPLKIENYIMPSIEPYSGFVTQKDIQILRETFLPLIEKKNRKNKIYISRRGTSRRRLSNEEEFENELGKLGFQIISFEKYSFIQQVEIMYTAEIIIAPHGAGLANLVFAEKGTKVIEIFPHWLYNDCFARLSINNNLNYKYIRCERDQDSAGIIPIPQVINLTKDLCT